MTLEEITEKIRSKVGEDCGLNAKVKFVLDGDKFIFIDASQVPNRVSNEDLEADATVRVSQNTFEKVMNGDTNAMTAFMMGKIKVEGNIGVVMNLGKVF